MSVGQYHAYKDEAWAAATACYDSLACEYQAIVLEGAGSPGEVNLKRHDIVNMRMAAYAGSPVLLVGDIDRGGIYASFVGTMEVLAEWERRLIAGFVVNRFRGQASLLAAAHDYVRDYTGREVFGVVPYFHDLDLPEEDSVSFKAGIYRRPQPGQPHVDIAVISLPHISNFTDVEPFLAEPDVHLRVVSRVDDLGTPDALILPGSKTSSAISASSAIPASPPGSPRWPARAAPLSASAAATSSSAGRSPIRWGWNRRPGRRWPASACSIPSPS